MFSQLSTLFVIATVSLAAHIPRVDAVYNTLEAPVCYAQARNRPIPDTDLKPVPLGKEFYTNMRLVEWRLF